MAENNEINPEINENSENEMLGNPTAPEEIPEEVSEEVTAEASETENETSEITEETEENANDEEAEEEIPEDELCIRCGKKRKTKDSDYCKNCRSELVKTKIPFGAWIAGIFVLLLGLFATAQIFLISAPAIQVAEGDKYARKNLWYSAYTAYNEVSSVENEISGIVGSETPFVKSGCGLKVKIIEAINKAYSPLEAANSISSVFTADQDGFVQHNKYLKECKEYFDVFQTTYSAISESGGSMINDDSSIDEVTKALAEARTKEGVDPIIVDYFVCSADLYLVPDDSERILKDFATLDANARKTGKDYAWLYYTDYAKQLMVNGETEKAIAMMDEMIASSKDNFNSYLIKLRSYIIAGDKDKANSVIEEFTEYNKTEDTKYVLQATLYRCSGEFEKLKTLCTEAFIDYDFNPEIHRQLAIGYLLEGDYDNAYEQAYAAEEGAYNLYSMGDSSGYTNELVNTVYVCTNLCKKLGKCNTENAQVIDQIIESYAQEEVSENAKALVTGKLKPEDVFMKGAFDLV